MANMVRKCGPMPSFIQRKLSSMDSTTVSATTLLPNIQLPHSPRPDPGTVHFLQSHSNLEEPGRQIPDPRQDPNRSIIAAVGSCGPHGSETPQALHIQCSPRLTQPLKSGGPSYQSHTTLPPLTVLIHTWLPLPSPPTPVGRAPSSCQSSRIASVGIIVGRGWWSDALSPKK